MKERAARKERPFRLQATSFELSLKGRRHRQAECFARLAEQVLRSVALDRLLVGKVAGATGREQVARDELSAAALVTRAGQVLIAKGPFVKPQWVISVIQPE